VTAVESDLLRRQAYVDGRLSVIGREGSSYGIDEWVELKYWAIGGVQ
jgi:hypothetical protein